MTKIIIAFTGTGKTTVAAGKSKLLDSDSDHFRWIRTGKERIENQQWPQNFINHPAEELSLRRYDAVLMSAYIEYLPAILQNGIPLTLVYPEITLKEEYIKRYRARGNPDWLIQFLSSHFEEWITYLMNLRCCDHVVLSSGQYLSDVLPKILYRP